MDAPTVAAKPLTHKDLRLFVIGAMLPVFMGAMDNTILASALPTIGRDLNDIHNLPWLITVFLLASTACMPLYGKIADIHGRRPVLCVAIVIHFAGSLICALSPSMAVLIFGRIVQGIGGRRPDLDSGGGARRRGGAQGPRQVRGLFCHRLHLGRRLRPGARRLPLRPRALVGDFLAQHPARDHRVDPGDTAVAAAAPLRAPAPARPDGRAC